MLKVWGFEPPTICTVPVLIAVLIVALAVAVAREPAY
jgi:hypothetical protein